MERPVKKKAQLLVIISLIRDKLLPFRLGDSRAQHPKLEITVSSRESLTFTGKESW
jgi:hypothetical protein